MILKGVVSSGMKQIIFSDREPGRFLEMLAQAGNYKAPAWILQQQVQPVPLPVLVFDETGARIEEKHYLRVTAYITADGVLGVDVTGRKNPMVHGAKDCIQIPVVSV